MLAPKEIAQMLGVSERTAHRLLAEGRIEAIRIGRLWRTTREKLDLYLLTEFARQSQPAYAGHSRELPTI